MIRTITATMSMLLWGLCGVAQAQYDPNSLQWATQAAYEFALQAGDTGLQNAITGGSLVVVIGNTGGDRGFGFPQANGTFVAVAPEGSTGEMCGAVAAHENTHRTGGHSPPPPAGTDFPNTSAEHAFWASECAGHEAAAAALVDRALGPDAIPPLCSTAEGLITDGAAACALADSFETSLPANPYESPIIGALFELGCQE